MSDSPAEFEKEPVDNRGPAPRPTPEENFRDSIRSRQRDDDDDDGEDELWEGGYSSKAMIGSWVGAAFGSAGLIVVTIFFLALWPVWLSLLLLMWVGLACCYYYRRWTKKYYLTSQRFIHESGLLKRTTDRIEVIDIDDVSFEQGLVQRMTGVGSITITSSDRSHPELVLRGIDDVKNVAGMIDDTRRKERRRRGLHIEAI